MIKELSEYFLPEQQFYLHKMTYERIEISNVKTEYFMNCTDNINVEIIDDIGLKIIVTRTLFFEPEEMFYLSVAFGADVKFDPKRKDEQNWYEINLAEEFRNNGDFVIGNLMSRISLLISQVTSSFGQQPLILPPSIAKPTNE